jgi:hypothetical protein
MNKEVAKANTSKGFSLHAFTLRCILHVSSSGGDFRNGYSSANNAYC